MQFAISLLKELMYNCTATHLHKKKKWVKPFARFDHDSVCDVSRHKTKNIFRFYETGEFPAQICLAFLSGITRQVFYLSLTLSSWPGMRTQTSQ